MCWYKFPIKGADVPAAENFSWCQVVVDVPHKIHTMLEIKLKSPTAFEPFFPHSLITVTRCACVCFTQILTSAPRASGTSVPSSVLTLQAAISVPVHLMDMSWLPTDAPAKVRLIYTVIVFLDLMQVTFLYCLTGALKTFLSVLLYACSNYINRYRKKSKKSC